MIIFHTILGSLFNYLEKSAIRIKESEYRKKFNISPSAHLGYLPHIVFYGNITIDDHSYFNSGKIITGDNSRIFIGKWCAIGYNVNIHAISHDPDISTGPIEQRPIVEKSINIGDNTWIGSNVFILPGVNIGTNCVIGANSVVNKDVPSNSIFGGVPAKFIRSKKNI